LGFETKGGITGWWRRHTGALLRPLPHSGWQGIGGRFTDCRVACGVLRIAGVYEVGTPNGPPQWAAAEMAN
jgi:hypothetical protein